MELSKIKQGVQKWWFCHWKRKKIWLGKSIKTVKKNATKIKYHWNQALNLKTKWNKIKIVDEFLHIRGCKNYLNTHNWIFLKQKN